jgi:predicted esterase/tetratricopeptide (TPR) repeat protein
MAAMVPRRQLAMWKRTPLWIRGLLAAVLLPAVVAAASEPVVPPAAELGPLLARYEAFAALSPDERARTKRPEFEHPPLSKEAAAAWKLGLWAAWKERLAARKPDVPPQKLGFPQGWLKPENSVTVGTVHTNVWTTPDKTVTVTMRYGARTVGKQPPQGWPVFINLHGGGDNPQSNDAGWVASMNQYPVQTGLCISPRSPVNTVGSWNDPLSIASLERLLIELPAKWDIDADRIYLMGYSMGAIGVLHIGPSMPDRWAAVAASAGFGYLGARGRSAPENLVNLPLMIQIGTADRDFQRYPLARAFAAAVRSLGEQNGSGYRIEFKEHPGKGHMIDDRDTPAWLAGFCRDPLPERIIWHQPMLPLPLGTADTPRMLERNPLFHAFLRRRCYWLRNDAPAAFQRLDVSRAGNEFRIDAASHVQRLTFLLDDRLVDLDEPVRVLAGKRELVAARVPRTVTALVASLVEYGDPELMFCAELDVAAPDSVAEMESRELKTAAELRVRAQERIALAKFAGAAADLEAALQLDPAAAATVLPTMRDIHSHLGDMPRFVDSTRRMATALPDDAMAQINAAEVLLNAQPESLRDPPAALECAGRAMKLTGNRNPQVAGLLALAQFRNGRRAEAVATVKAALALVPANQLPKLRAELEAALETYSAANAE